MTKGKVVLVPFPFDDLSATKVRPAVCLTNPIGQYNHIILALITSTIPTHITETDIVLNTDHSDFTASGLRKSSTLKLDFLVTVRSSIILRELGQLSENTQDEISRKLCKLLSE
ncbi:type II toxin-antitoxin system PemK/MazF family toxin [Planktothrix mougeotii]|uniref:Type II toxin-antitoxin system PemK/MazF family toxin n=1 Tax=Planktothrix mougeotii LEGE 06226 TaxID=1828728 RepID=A0ABR9UDU2_9CYAN|nr:type II toxin-antitoxin system PemK/MazF family toxin [Planktothrix mougeotii]MBE9144632.1 type II toxin-antitoxin system PemK/MazF family toxin [Planktothrix mougeotii LEGE 06226]